MPLREGWVYAAWLSLVATVISSGASSARDPQNIDENLLQFIKHDLRRNNEDYNELPFTNDGTASAPLSLPAPHTAGIHLGVSVLASTHHTAPSDQGAPRATKRLDYFDRNNILGLNEKMRNTKKVINEVHGARGALQDVLPRSRLLTLFASTAVSGTRPTVAYTSATRVNTTATDIKNFVQRKHFASMKPVPGEGLQSRESPLADILDMAPARGNRISAKRAKGRLCQRHVLLPEGPKYDSNGEVYLQPHGGRRSFPKTRAPRLLLPICCNCCKKSVLGCE